METNLFNLVEFEKALAQLIEDYQIETDLGPEILAKFLTNSIRALDKEIEKYNAFIRKGA